MTHKPLQVWSPRRPVYVGLRLKSDIATRHQFALEPSRQSSAHVTGRSAALACLQNRLNALDQNIAIRIEQW